MLETKGNMWLLPRPANIETANFRLPLRWANRITHPGRDPWDSLELQMLVEKLEQRNEDLLAAKLQSYLDQRMNLAFLNKHQSLDCDQERK